MINNSRILKHFIVLAAASAVTTGASDDAAGSSVNGADAAICAPAADAGFAFTSSADPDQ